MKLRFSTLLAILIAVALFIMFSTAVIPEMEQYSTLYYDYIIKYAAEEIGSQNLVTGIYLKYRIFDSLMEAAVLFVTTVGILFMGKKDEDVR